MANTNDSKTIVGIVCLALITPLFLLATILLHRYRKVFNLKARGSYTQVANAVFLLSLWFLCGFYLVWYREVDCNWVVLFSVALNAVCMIGTVRCWILIFRFRIAQELTAFRAVNGTTTGKMAHDQLIASSWFIRHRSLITVRSLIISASSVMVVLELPVFAVLHLSDSCDSVELLNLKHLALIVLFYVIAIVVLTQFFRKTDRDTFGIRTELRAAFLFGALALLIVSVLANLSPEEAGSDKDTYLNASVAVSITGFLGSWLISIIWPLCVAARTVEVEQVSLKVIDITTLSDLLAIDSGFESFLNYSKTEFASENALFWQAYTTFKAKYSDASQVLLNRDECIQDAQTLVYDFIHDNSPSQVNLPAEIREPLLRAFTALQNSAPPTPAATALAPNALADTHTHTPSNSWQAKTNTTNSERSSVVTIPEQSMAIVMPTPTDIPLSTAIPASSSSSSTLGASASVGRDRIALSIAHPTNDSVSVETLSATMDAISIFDQAAKTIYKLMVFDILPRYIKSDEFREFVKSWTERQNDRGSSRTNHSDPEQGVSQPHRSEMELDLNSHIKEFEQKSSSQLTAGSLVQAVMKISEFPVTVTIS